MLSNLTQHNGAFSTSSDYQSSQFLAGLEWARHWVDVEGTVLDVLLGLEINTELIEAYDESQLFEWDSRDITQVQPRIEVDYTSKPLHPGLTLSTRLNASYIVMIDGEEQDYSINTQAVSFDDSDESKIYVGASLGINYQLSDAAMLHAKIEAYDSDEDIQLFAARLRFDLKF